MVYHDHARAEARLQRIKHAAHIRVIAEAQEHEFRTKGGGRRVFRDLALVCLLPRSALGTRPVPDADLVPGPGQMPRHVKPHHAKSKECRPRHVCLSCCDRRSRSNFIEIIPFA